MRKPKQPATIDLSQRLTLSVAETCSVLGLGKTSVYELLNANAFDSFLLGKQRLIVVASIVSWIDAMNYTAKLDKEINHARP